MTMNSYPKFPKAVNETVKEYPPNSPEKEAVLKSYRTLFKENTQVPLTINGEKITTETKGKCAPLTITSTYWGSTPWPINIMLKRPLMLL